MKLKEWLDFNSDTYCGDILIKALKEKSYSRDDIIFEAVMRTDRAAALFGNYELKKIRVDKYPGSEYRGLMALIWIPNIN